MRGARNMGRIGIGALCGRSLRRLLGLLGLLGVLRVVVRPLSGPVAVRPACPARPCDRHAILSRLRCCCRRQDSRAGDGGGGGERSDAVTGGPCM